MRRYVAALALALLAAPGAVIVLSAAPGPALAMGGLDPAPTTAADPDYQAGKTAIAAKHWKAAIADLNKAAARTPKDPDIQNYLGYAYRNAGNVTAAMAHYHMALKIDPGHLGAHEYLGEAYLLQGNLTQAETELGTLDHLCTLGCAEYSALKAKVAAYKQAHPAG